MVTQTASRDTQSGNAASTHVIAQSRRKKAR
jgi:hypothetical protein